MRAVVKFYKMGRKKQFDEQKVLDKAMLSFWKHGYENTTTRQLEQDMGINQFSIYATFKNKGELFKRVLINYMMRLDQQFLQNLKKEKADIHDVEEFLLNFALSIKENKVPNSCMMVSSAMRMETFDIETREIMLNFFRFMKQLFQKALRNSIKSNNISPTNDIDQESEYLLGIAQSISIYSKVKSKDEIVNYIQFSIAKIK